MQKYITEVIEKLGTTKNKQNIMIECRDKFYKPDFVDNLDMNTKLVCFTNGVFDFETLLFRDGKPNDMCSMCTNIPMIPLTPEEMLYMDDVNERIFYNPLGKSVGNYFKLIVAKALAGDKQKIISYCIGISNSGKSTITVVCSSAFGDYVGSFNAESLACKKTGQDEGQLMRWLLLLQKKRLIFSNEGSGGQDGNIIKKITGGDPLVARLHCKNEQTFYFNGLPISFANDFPKIKPFDKAVANRIRVVPFDKEFVDVPTNEFQLKKINEDVLKEEMNTELFKRVFVGLIIKAYIEYVYNEKKMVEPDEVVRAIEEWTEGEGNNFIPKFLEDYEITNDVKDYVVSKDMQTWNEVKNPGISFVAFSKELKKHCIIQHYDKVFNKAKKINGKSLMCWFGVRQIKYNPELEHEEDIDEDLVLEEV
jgi:phage/plasmid-associated DNA primase